MDLSMKQTQTHRQDRLVVSRGRGGGGGGERDGLGVWDWQVHAVMCRLWITNKLLPYSTGSYSQYPATNVMGKNVNKNRY